MRSLALLALGAFVLCTLPVRADAPLSPVLINPEEGALVGGTVVVNGTAKPSATITLLLDDVPWAAGLADTMGHFSITLPMFADGLHAIRATATLGTETSDLSEAITFQFDGTRPDAPVLTDPEDGSSSDDPLPTFTGHAEPGSTVTIVIDGVGGGETTASEADLFSLTVTEPLEDGEHAVSVYATDAAGNASDETTLTFTTDLLPPDPPTLGFIVDGSVLSDATPEMFVVFSSQGTQTARVYVDGALAATVTTDDWFFTVTLDALTEGSHTLYMTSTDAFGHLGEKSDTLTFIIDTVAPEAPVITSPTNDARLMQEVLTVRGTGEIGAEVALYIDGTSRDSDTIADGVFSITRPPLVLGEHTAYVIATDAAGNASEGSAIVRFTVVSVGSSVDAGVDEDAGVVPDAGEGDATFDGGDTHAGGGCSAGRASFARGYAPLAMLTLCLLRRSARRSRT